MLKLVRRSAASSACAHGRLTESAGGPVWEASVEQQCGSAGGHASQAGTVLVVCRECLPPVGGADQGGMTREHHRAFCSHALGVPRILAELHETAQHSAFTMRAPSPQFLAHTASHRPAVLFSLVVLALFVGFLRKRSCRSCCHQTKARLVALASEMWHNFPVAVPHAILKCVDRGVK